jgi:hypothetical protein
LLNDITFGKTFKEILKYCSTPRTKTDIENFVEKRLGVTYEKDKVFTAYFVASLESSGGIHWANGRWEATETGKRAAS